jgi:hypothetical protein
MALDEAGVSRIVAAVGRGRAPKNIDRNELRQNIAAAWNYYQELREESGRARTQRSKQAAKIADLAGDLLKLLEDPKHVKLIDRLSFGFPICEGVPVLDAEWEAGPGGRPMYRADDPLRRHLEPSFDGLKDGLKKLRYVAEQTGRARPRKSPPRGSLEVTPLTWLIGKELMDVYELSFQRRAGRSRRPDAGGKPYGPFLRFVAAVMREFDEAVSDHTIEGAIRAVRALKRRSPPS